MSNKTKKAIDIIWDYMQLRQSIVPSDALILLGSRDDRVANYAATYCGMTLHQYVS